MIEDRRLETTAEGVSSRATNMLTDEIDALLEYTRDEWTAEDVAPTAPGRLRRDRRDEQQRNDTWRSRLDAVRHLVRLRH